MVNRTQFEDAGGFRFDWYAILLLVAAVAGAILVLARGLGYGVGLNLESVEHIGAARSLLAGDGFAGYGGWSYASFPPLYPLLLAAASLWVFDPHSTAGPLNAVLFAATILVAGIYLRARLQSGLLSTAGCLALLLSVPLTGAAAWALPEPAFILFVTLALIQTDRFLNAGRLSTLLSAAAFTALAVLTNYMGLALLATVVLLLILQGGTAAADKVKRIGIYTPIALIPPALWLLRNLLTDAGPAGYPDDASGAFGAALAGLPVALFGWIFPDLPGVSLAQMGLGAVMIALGGLGLLLLILLSLFAIAYDYAGRSDGDYYDEREPRPGYVFGGFALVYIVALLVTLALGNPDGGFQARQLAPLYLPALLLALLLADVFLTRRQEQGITGAVSAPLIVLAAVLGIWLALLAVSNGRAIAAANQGNAAELGYASAGWADSPLPAYLAQAATDGGAIFTNNLAAAYIHQGTEAELELRRLPCNPAELPTALDAPDGAGPVAALWFPGRADWECPVPVEAAAYRTASLLTTPGLEPAALLGYGVAFAFDASRAGDADLYRPYPARDLETGAELGTDADAFAVYVGARTVSYLRETCAADDTDAEFYLHITPNDRSVLPAARRPAGTEMRNFRFEDRGAIIDGQCLAFAPLPDYSISQIRTGQSAGPPWEVHATLYRSKYDYVVAGTPILRDDFDVYHRGYELVYIRESCAVADTDAPFLLHLTPVDAGNLPAEQRESGFLNRDFTFGAAGGRFDDKCLASITLPDYALGVIRTGQYLGDGDQLWDAEFYTDAYYDALRARYVALTAGELLANGFFDIYRNADRMAYARTECAASDTDAPFFLHLFPDDVNDLPADRQEHGYGNQDFGFEQRGGLRIDGKCVVTATLPDYPLAGIRTGQYIPGQDRLWVVATLPDADTTPGGTAATVTAAAAAATTAAVPTQQQPGASAAAPTPEVDFAELRARYASLAAAEPIVEDVFDLYLDSAAGELIYASADCAGANTAAVFYLHLIPADVNDLPAERREHGYYNREFEFGPAGGGQFDGICLVAVPLPDYTVIGLSTGQYALDGQGYLWSAQQWLPAVMYEYIQTETPLVRGEWDFDVYFKNGRLYYLEILCSAQATKSDFFLHIFAVSSADLPTNARESGFENRDFSFDSNGARLGRQCIASAPLPDYPIRNIRTGQHIPGVGRLWEAEFPLPEPE